MLFDLFGVERIERSLSDPAGCSQLRHDSSAARLRDVISSFEQTVWWAHAMFFDNWLFHWIGPMTTPSSPVGISDDGWPTLPPRFDVVV